jgi:hypothetical protein
VIGRKMPSPTANRASGRFSLCTVNYSFDHLVNVLPQAFAHEANVIS